MTISLTSSVDCAKATASGSAQQLTQRRDCGIARGMVNGFRGNVQSHDDSFLAGDVLG
jgi:hypothetical protein